MSVSNTHLASAHRSRMLGSTPAHCGGTWLPRHNRLPATYPFQVVARRAAHLEITSNTDDVARHLSDLERLLPGMSLGQLANAFSSCVHTFRAASLAQTATSDTDETITRIVDYFTNQLPDQSWLLTLRAAVASHVSRHPAVVTKAPEALTAPAATQSSSDASTFQLQHQHLSQIVAALAALPIIVVQPLPIGFGTPRWYRPLAAADPAAWENWLADVAAVYTAALQQEHQQNQHPVVPTTGSFATAASAFVQQHGALVFSHSSAAGINLGSFIAAAAAGGTNNQSVRGRRNPGCDERQQHQQLLEQLADFMINLACCMRWSNVNVDDDRLRSRDFKEKVLQCMQQQLDTHPARSVPIQQQPQHTQPHTISPRPPTPEPWLLQNVLDKDLGGDDDELQECNKQQVAERQPQDIALAGSFMHRITYSMLLLLLPPPRPLLTAFFNATAETMPELFTLKDLQGLVRGLLFLGEVPSEPWLRALVRVLRGRAQDMEPRDVQGFVEGLRFFGTKARKAGWLRDATAQLEEFTLC